MLKCQALCLKWAMETCISLQLWKVNFETDCLSLFNIWAGKIFPNSFTADVVAACKSLVHSFSEFSFSHISRLCNKPANFMSKLAYSIHYKHWIGTRPFGWQAPVLEDSDPTS